jgi:hypothetical protein
VDSLREIISISDLSAEEQMKLKANITKAAEQGHKGFATAIKNSGLAATLAIQDSAESRDLVEEAVVATEPSENVEAEPVVAEKSVEPEPEETKPEVSSPVITPELLQQFVQQSVQNAIAPLQSELERERSEKEAIRSQLNEAQKSQDILSGLGQLLGKSETTPQKTSLNFPNVNTNLSPNRDQIDGRLAEFMSIRDSVGVSYRNTEKGVIPMAPTEELDRWMRNQRRNKSDFNELMSEMTKWGKKFGLFKGTRMITQGEMRAATTAADIPGGFLEVLSSIMRTNNRPGYVFWQLPTTIHRYDRGEGEVVDIPRAAYPARPSSSTERLLSGSDTYVPIDNSNQRVRTGLVKFILNEYGRGRPEAPPISIPTFVEQYSMIPLMGLLERDLFYDYYAWEDLIIREQWRPTTAVYYNNGDEVVTAASSVAAGGQMTRAFLTSVYTKLANDQVVPLPDGNFGLVTHPTGMKQLKLDLDALWRPPSPEEVQEFTNMFLNDYPAGEDMKISNYRGLYEGFHIFETNAFSNGGSGTEGVATETDGNSDSLVFRTSYAFGYGASGRGIGGSGVQILFDEKTDFGRIDRAIWQSYESHGPLDVDAAGYGETDTTKVNQETRVFKVMTSDTVSAA